MNRYCKTHIIILSIFLSVQIVLSKVPRPENLPIQHLPYEIIQELNNLEKPPPPVRNIAEFEPMEASLIRYPLNFPVELVKDLAENAKVYCYTGSSQQSQATQTFTNGGVNISNVEYIDLYSRDFWPRDHGPWYIVDGQNRIGIIDFIYEENWNAPEVDTMPHLIAELFNLPIFKMNITGAGGNYMTDGWGTAFSSDKVERINPSLSTSQINTLLKDYCGIENYHLLKDPNSDDINLDHVDCWAKYLSPDKVIIRKVPSNDPDYNGLEEVVDYFENLPSAYGTPFKIYRVTSQGKKEAYTNSLIFNNNVFVPFSSSSNDAPALDAYKEAMPGYTVKGYTYSGWKNYDALHCRVMGLADKGMLYIRHIPLHDTITDSGTGVALEATVIPYSNELLISDSCVVYYKQKDETSFKSVTLINSSDNLYEATIPSLYKNGEIHYFIHAADESGRKENHPYIGAPDPHVFYYVNSGIGILTDQQLLLKQLQCSHYPEPFVHQVTISWDLPAVAKNATLRIYSTRGLLIREWNIHDPSNTVTWNGSTQYGEMVSAGVYLYSLQNGNITVNRKMRLIR